MNEKKKKKPLLSYEQVVGMIEERIASEENDNRDERIVRIEKAAEELENKRKKVKQADGRKFPFKSFWKRLFQCRRK